MTVQEGRSSRGGLPLERRGYQVSSAVRTTPDASIVNVRLNFYTLATFSALT